MRNAGKFGWLLSVVFLFMTACGQGKTGEVTEESLQPAGTYDWKAKGFAVSAEVQEEQKWWIEKYNPDENSVDIEELPKDFGQKGEIPMGARVVGKDRIVVQSVAYGSNKKGQLIQEKNYLTVLDGNGETGRAL